jgi:trans-aconitate methyltransferase
MARVLDYGLTSKLLLTALGAEYAVGVDVSEASIAVARAREARRSLLSRVRTFKAPGEIDLAYCNGVFHHIPVRSATALLRLSMIH